MASWFRDARIFVRECLGVTPDIWQDEALEAISVGNYDCLALIACKGPGKSAVLAWIDLWFMFTRRNAQVMVTSITKPNLKDGLWKEIGLWHERSPIIKACMTYTAERLFHKENPEKWWTSARGWSQDATGQEQADTLAGFHNDKAMFLGDEFGGCSMGLLGAIEAIRANAGTYPPGPDLASRRMAGLEAKLCVAGNPTDPMGPLGKISGELRGKPWHVINITADPIDPKRTPRVNAAWAQEQIDKHPGGRTHPFVMVNILGQFPPSGFNQMFSLNEVQKAMNLKIDPDVYKWSQKRLAVDVALQGNDETTLMMRQGLFVDFNPDDIMKNATIPEIVSRIAMRSSIFTPELVAVDATGGWGSGVVQGCVDAGMTVIPVQFAGKADDDRYLNKRAEMYWRLKSHLERGGSLPKNDQLLRELTCMKYGTTPAGKFYIESKDEIRKRLQHSTDLADALCMTFALPELPGTVEGRHNPILSGMEPQQCDITYRPYAKRASENRYRPYRNY